MVWLRARSTTGCPARAASAAGPAHQRRVEIELRRRRSRCLLVVDRSCRAAPCAGTSAASGGGTVGAGGQQRRQAAGQAAGRLPDRERGRRTRAPARPRRRGAPPASRPGCARRTPPARSSGAPGCGAPRAARTLPHGSSGVTGESEPNASATPTPCIAPIGLDASDRSTPSRCAYIRSGAAPQPVERRLHAGHDPELDEPGDQRLVDHLHVLDAVPARPQPVHARPPAPATAKPASTVVDRRVADRVEAALHAVRGRSRPGARPPARRSRSRARSRRARPAYGSPQVRRPRAERAVGVQVAARADRAQLAGLRRRHQLAPVAVHLGQPVGRPASASSPVKSASLDVPGPPHSCTAAIPSARRPAAARSAAPPSRCAGRHRAERHRPHHVVGLARAASPTRRSPACRRLGAAASSAVGAQRRVDRRLRQVHPPAAGRPGPARPPSAGVLVGPGRLVPAVPEHHRVGRAGRPRTPATASQHLAPPTGRRTGPARRRASPVSVACTCASTNAGVTSAPSRSTTVGRRPARRRRRRARRSGRRRPAARSRAGRPAL